LAKLQSALFRDEGERGEDEEPTIPDIIQITNRFEEGGVGIGKSEAFRVSLSMRKLAAKHPITKLRFWGKILGLEKNYFIVEAEYKDGEAPKPEEVCH
jgi:radial spoke head protein 4A